MAPSAVQVHPWLHLLSRSIRASISCPCPSPMRWALDASQPALALSHGVLVLTRTPHAHPGCGDANNSS